MRPQDPNTVLFQMTILLSKQNRYGYCALKNPAVEEVKSEKREGVKLHVYDLRKAIYIKSTQRI